MLSPNFRQKIQLDNTDIEHHLSEKSWGNLKFGISFVWESVFDTVVNAKSMTVTFHAERCNNLDPVSISKWYGQQYKDAVLPVHVFPLYRKKRGYGGLIYELRMLRFDLVPSLIWLLYFTLVWYRLIWSMTFNMFSFKPCIWHLPLVPHICQ